MQLLLGPHLMRWYNKWRANAEKDLRRLAGLTGITNNIAIAAKLPVDARHRQRLERPCAFAGRADARRSARPEYGCRLTSHSSRTRFADRLNSGVALQGADANMSRGRHP